MKTREQRNKDAYITRIVNKIYIGRSAHKIDPQEIRITRTFAGRAVDDAVVAGLIDLKKSPFQCTTPELRATGLALV